MVVAAPAIDPVTAANVVATRSTPHSSTCSSAAIAIGRSSKLVRCPMSNRRAPGWYSSR